MGGSRWLKFILMSGAVVVWQTFDLSTATEAPSQAVLVLQYGALVLALISLVGSLIMLVRERVRGA